MSFYAIAKKPNINTTSCGMNSPRWGKTSLTAVVKQSHPPPLKGHETLARGIVTRLYNQSLNEKRNLYETK